MTQATDAVVSMRFHATIFALFQRVSTPGIDYRTGKRDKVATPTDRRRSGLRGQSGAAGLGRDKRAEMRRGAVRRSGAGRCGPAHRQF